MESTLACDLRFKCNFPSFHRGAFAFFFLLFSLPQAALYTNFSALCWFLSFCPQSLNTEGSFCRKCKINREVHPWSGRGARNWSLSSWVSSWPFSKIAGIGGSDDIPPEPLLSHTGHGALGPLFPNKGSKVHV